MNKFTTSFLLSVILFVSCKKQEFDLVIRGATVYDGAGNAGVVTDVGIKADTIASVGNLSKAIGKVEVDANGLVLSPGFIDTHSHHGWGRIHRLSQWLAKVSPILCEIMCWVQISNGNQPRQRLNVAFQRDSNHTTSSTIFFWIFFKIWG